MSRPPEHEYGTPQGPPNVYHPQPESVPSYEEYADPAVAHGWLNAYDETREMPPAVDREAGRPRVGGSRRKPKRSTGGAAHGRRASTGPWGLAAPPRRSRKIRHSPAPLWGALVAGGVVVALVAVFSFGGPSSGPSGGVQGKDESAAPTVGGSASPTASEAPGGAVTDRPTDGGAESSPAASLSPSVPSSRTASGGGTRESSAGTSTAGATATPTSTVSAAGPPGRSGSNPGHGQGGSKGPKQP